MSYEKDGVLNVLHRTGVAEIVCHAPVDDTAVPQTDTEPLQTKLSTAESSLEILMQETELYQKEHNIKAQPVAEISLSYGEFMDYLQSSQEVEATIAKVGELVTQKTACKNAITRTARDIEVAKTYACVTQPFSACQDSKHTVVRLGTVSVTAKDGLYAKLNQNSLIGVEELGSDGEQAVVLLVAHREAAEELSSLLTEFGFAECPYKGETSNGEQVLARCESAHKTALLSAAENEKAFYQLRDDIPSLKIYCDRLAFELEKAQADSSLLETQKTFWLEAYVPAESETAVKDELEASGNTCYFEFSDPLPDEQPPTLLKNNKVVANFEGITNMYSPPNYREFDPNTVMAFFYSVFMGFIIGDMGYGILMTLFGGLLAYKKKGTGMGSLCAVFAFGGLFAILWGFLFNSLFGVAVLPFTVMPDAQNDFCSFMGVTVPSVLVIALMIGIVQLCTGYVCRAVQAFRRGKIADGILDGLVWALFSVGVLLAVIGLTEGLTVGSLTLQNLTVLGYVGGILAGASLLVAMCTAGRKEKLLGKFTKGFGAAYGVINYASDILSYARLYGLMLSGAVIAQIVSTYAIDFITGGNVLFAIIGVLLMVVGHVFNIAMSLLGAYIHDARLQYVEFYGRFYEGEGELFAPLGSSKKYVTITK
jgi:V/A-type H+-transporting ATPase subunit I